MILKSVNTSGPQFVRQLLGPLGAPLTDAQLQRRVRAARISLLHAVPAVGGTTLFVAAEKFVPQADGLYLEIELQPRAQQVLFVPEGESTTEPPRLREDAIGRCGDIHAAVDGAEPENPVVRGEIRGALRHLDGTTLAMTFPDGQLELSYPSAPVPEVCYEAVVVSGTVCSIEPERLCFKRSHLTQSGNNTRRRARHTRLPRKLSIWFQAGSPANADARIAAVHAMNAGERIQINAIVPISTDEDTIDELRFVGFPACTNEVAG